MKTKKTLTGTLLYRTIGKEGIFVYDSSECRESAVNFTGKARTGF